MVIQLIDKNKEMVDAWNSEFSNIHGGPLYANIEIHLGDIFTFKTECLLAPSNSFGVMDGGLDLQIINRLGKSVQHLLQSHISLLNTRELLVGQVMILPTGSDKIPTVVVAPTMRIPCKLSEDSINVYLSFRAALLACNSVGIKRISVSGIGSGIGGMSCTKVAKQMHHAFVDAHKDSTRSISKTTDQYYELIK